MGGPQADILCLGKALTGGTMTLAATVASEAVARGIEEAGPEQGGGVFMHGPTFMGNALACSVALRSIQLFEEGDYLSRIARIQQICRRELADLDDPRIQEVRIMGDVPVSK